MAQLREGERAGCGAQLQAELESYLELQGWMHEASAALRNGECGIARTFYANILQRTSAPPVRLGLVQARPIPPLDLPCISPASPVYLP